MCGKFKIKKQKKQCPTDKNLVHKPGYHKFYLWDSPDARTHGNLGWNKTAKRASTTPLLAYGYTASWLNPTAIATAQAMQHKNYMTARAARDESTANDVILVSAK